MSASPLIAANRQLDVLLCGVVAKRKQAAGNTAQGELVGEPRLGQLTLSVTKGPVTLLGNLRHPCPSVEAHHKAKVLPPYTKHLTSVLIGGNPYRGAALLQHERRLAEYPRHAAIPTVNAALPPASLW